jgi:hypothetical protein
MAPDLFLEAGWDFSRKAGGREEETPAVRILLSIKHSTKKKNRELYF